jgi:predicted transcriptional regulator
MAIQPPYARGILAGTKKVEFRKRTLAADVTTVLIYETAPTQMIVGTFTVAGVASGPPGELWTQFERVAGIEQDAYNAYYEDKDEAVALRVADAIQLERPVRLCALRPAPAVPQSFSYLSDAVLDQLREAQPAAVDLLRLFHSGTSTIARPLRVLADVAEAASDLLGGTDARASMAHAMRVVGRPQGTASPRRTPHLAQTAGPAPSAPGSPTSGSRR